MTDTDRVTLRRRAMIIVLLLIAGCTTSPPRFDAESARAIDPAQAVEGHAVFAGEPVLWGGRIAHVRNDEDATRLEILYYPLGENQRPDTDQAAGDRFIAVQPGFLDPSTYSRGRLITVAGKLDGTERGRVGEHPYTYPRVRMNDHELWPKPPKRRETPRSNVNFGFGITIH